MESREVIYSTDVYVKRVAGARQEDAMDLGYRVVMPSCLGNFLCRATSKGSLTADMAGQEVEEYATAHKFQSAMDKDAPSFLGLVCRIRAEYAERLDASFSVHIMLLAKLPHRPF